MCTLTRALPVTIGGCRVPNRALALRWYMTPYIHPYEDQLNSRPFSGYCSYLVEAGGIVHLHHVIND